MSPSQECVRLLHRLFRLLRRAERAGGGVRAS